MRAMMEDDCDGWVWVHDDPDGFYSSVEDMRQCYAARGVPLPPVVHACERRVLAIVHGWCADTETLVVLSEPRPEAPDAR